MLTPEQQATLEATSNPSDPFAPQNAVVRNTRSLWPGGVVPYILDSSLNSEFLASATVPIITIVVAVVVVKLIILYYLLADRARSAIQSAISAYTQQTCIRFVPRTNERDYARFFAGNG